MILHIYNLKTIVNKCLVRYVLYLFAFHAYIETFAVKLQDNANEIKTVGQIYFYVLLFAGNVHNSKHLQNFTGFIFCTVSRGWFPLTISILVTLKCIFGKMK